MNSQATFRSLGRAFLPAVTSAWCTYLVIDFLTHAVFLASYWRATESYRLPPRELFRMIPLAYALFAIYCAISTWLLIRLYGNQPKLAIGLRFGATAGILLGANSALGSYCVFRMPASALIVWPLSVTVASAGAGAVAAWVLVADHPWRRVGFVFGAAVLLFVLGVVTQNLISSLSSLTTHSPYGLVSSAVADKNSMPRCHA